MVKNPSIFVVLLAYLGIGLGPPAWALPNEGQVAGGRAGISRPTAQQLHVVQSTDKAIINWKNFNIAADELVKFVQPSAGSIALNRVVGGDPSVIMGQLLANGRVFLVNPNGILFGSSAVVNTAGLLATTFNITDSDFLAGKFHFGQDPAKALSYVINKGTIRVSDNGFVLLVAPAVSNEGLIVANLGKAVLGSGEKLLVDFMGDGLITYAIDGKVLQQVKGPDGQPFSSSVSNSGTIQADGGHVLLSAKAASEMFASVINQSGIIEARSLVNRGGVIRLEGSDPVANTGSAGWQANLGKIQKAEGKVLHTGTLDVSAAEAGAAQGETTITGEVVGVAGTIAARGVDAVPGGRVLIASSEKTIVTRDGTIDSSGSGHSDGGNVVVWSDKDTVFRGSILAKGGELAGDGGHTEVSGHRNLEFSGHVDALAPHGTTGTLLLDPNNITVATGGTATLPQVDQFSDTPATNLTIAPATLNGAAANVTLQANNDITISNAVAMTNPGIGLTMQAGRDITVNASISTNNGPISMTANDSAAIAANRTAGTGDITFGAGANLSAGSGNIGTTVGSSTTAPFNPGSISNVRNMTTTTGSITINSPNAVTLAGAVNAGSGTVTVNANTDGAGAQGLTMNAGSSITTTNATAAAVQINVNAAGGGTGPASLGNLTATFGTLTVATNSGGNTTGGAVTQGASTSLNVGTALLSTGNGAITLNNAGNDFGTASVSRGTNITLRDANTLDLGASTIAGTLNITANGAVTQTGALAVTGVTTVAAGAANDITLNNAGNNFSTVGVTSGNNVILRDANALALGTSTVTGALDVTTNGALTQSGAVTVAGATTLAAGTTNDITLNNAANNFSTVGVTSGRNITLRDANALTVDTSTVSGTANITTNGALTQSGALAVTGTTTVAAGAGNDIILNNAVNDFGTIGITSGRNVTLQDANAVSLGTSTVSGAMNVTTAGAVTQTGALAVTGVTTVAAGAANDITLNNAANNFSTVGITSANNVTLRDTNALILGASSLSGALNVITNGALTQSGALAVIGTTTVAAGAGNDIILNNAANDFSTVGVTSGRNVALRDANALNVGPSTIAGTLNVTANGVVTQTGALAVTGATTLAAGAANNITLNNAGNNFSTVGVMSGNNVILRDANALALGTSTVTGALDVTTNGALTQSGAVTVTGPTTVTAGAGNNVSLTNAGNNFSTVSVTSGNNVALRDMNALVLGASTASGTLNVTTNGSLTQSGALSVTGTTTLAAGAANDVTLDNPTNDFSTVGVTSGRNVTLQDANALILGASTVTGTLNVTTNGSLTQSGALTVTGATTLAAGVANDITLSNAANNFSTVGVTSGNNVTLRDASAVVLGTSTVTGTLDVTTNGALTQSGAVTVAGPTTVAAGTGNNITLNNTGNDFGTVGITSGRNVTLQDANALTLGASTVTGTLNVTTNGSLTQSGALAVTGATTLTAGVANDITLSNAANNFSTVNVASGNNVTLRDSNALGLGSLTLSGILDVTANGGITDANGAATNITAPTASLTATGIGTAANPIETNLGSLTATTSAGGIFVSQAGPITLNNVVAGSGNIVINNSLGDMTINTVQASSGNVNLTTAGSLLDGNGATNNVTASAGSTLNALGVIGRSIDPLEVNVNGTLGVAASNQIDNISVIINGTVSPGNTLMILNAPPGEVIFNGVVLYPLAPAAGGSHPLTPDLGPFVRNSSTLKTEDVVEGSDAVILVAEDLVPVDVLVGRGIISSADSIKSKIADEPLPVATDSDPASASALESSPSLSAANPEQHPTEVEEIGEVQIQEEPIVVANAVPLESGHEEIDAAVDHSTDRAQRRAAGPISHEHGAATSHPGGTSHENGVSPAFDEETGRDIAAIDISDGADSLANIRRLAPAAEATGELRDVPFDFESWRVSEEVMQALIRVAEWMKTNPAKRLIIAGHADERGTSSYNLALGEKRARTIGNILVDLGVEAERLTVVSYGKERPVCREQDETCYRQNRRGQLEADMSDGRSPSTEQR